MLGAVILKILLVRATQALSTCPRINISTESDACTFSILYSQPTPKSKPTMTTEVQV